jgi:hypothetical protein
MIVYIQDPAQTVALVNKRDQIILERQREESAGAVVDQYTPREHITPKLARMVSSC